MEVEDDVEFEIDSVTGEVINLDGISLDEECEDEEDGDEEAGADEPVEHAEPVKQATEAQMPSSMEKVILNMCCRPSWSHCMRDAFRTG